MLQVIIKISHIADFEQVLKKLVIFLTLNKSHLKIVIFLTLNKSYKQYHATSIEATTLCHQHSALASQIYEGLHQL